MKKMISKNETFAVIKIVGDIRDIELKEDKNKELSLQLKIGFKGGTIFAYAKSEAMINEMLDLKVKDIIKVKGKFINIWYPTAKGNFAAIDNIEKWWKLGILE